MIPATRIFLTAEKRVGVKAIRARRIRADLIIGAGTAGSEDVPRMMPTPSPDSTEDPRTSITKPLLADLLRQAGLPPAAALSPITGRGFENEIHRVRLCDGQEVLLRRYPKERESEQRRAAFLAQHHAPAPKLLASSSSGALYEFVQGTLLGDLIEAGQATEKTWRLIGEALRRVHEVEFPCGLYGEIRPDQVILQLNDPVAQMHRWLEEAVPGFRRRVPTVIEHLPSLHELIDRAADALRAAPSALGHGDIHMWNIIVAEDRATLIDWDSPIVCDPAMEIALLDKHAWLFNGRGIDPGFFQGYGKPAAEPNTSLYRIVHTVNWAGSSDWEEFERVGLPHEQLERTRQWLRTLQAYAGNIEKHIERLRQLV